MAEIAIDIPRDYDIVSELISEMMKDFINHEINKEINKIPIIGNIDVFHRDYYKYRCIFNIINFKFTDNITLYLEVDVLPDDGKPSKSAECFLKTFLQIYFFLNHIKASIENWKENTRTDKKGNSFSCDIIIDNCNIQSFINFINDIIRDDYNHGIKKRIRRSNNLNDKEKKSLIHAIKTDSISHSKNLAPQGLQIIEEYKKKNPKILQLKYSDFAVDLLYISLNDSSDIINIITVKRAHLIYKKNGAQDLCLNGYVDTDKARINVDNISIIRKDADFKFALDINGAAGVDAIKSILREI